VKTTRTVAPRRARPVIGRPSYVAPRYHSRWWGRTVFVFLILVVCGIVGGVGGVLWSLHRAQSDSGRAVRVHVGSGDTVQSLAERLQQRGLVSNALLFRVDARLQGLAGKLRPGIYTLHRNMSIDGMIGALAVYKPDLFQITIPEGLRYREIAARLRTAGMDERSFLREVQHPDAAVNKLPISRDRPSGRSLEGYLFPNTYNLQRGSTGRDLAILMVQQLQTMFTPAMREQARKHHLSIYQALTLASIVEREARVESERPVIAGVYMNRLRDGMVMNADPTIQYAVGQARHWWPVLSLDQLKINSPYNSYIYKGLPPTPIANPGFLSISAAVNPASTKYLYFVAKRDNLHHAFAQTLAEQEAHIAQYQK